MSQLRVGLVGWRGMVGSVLMQRMIDENDFEGITPVFFSTSNAGGDAPTPNGIAPSKLEDAHDLALVMPLLPVKAVTILKKSINRYVIKAGQVTGLMQQAPCV